MDNNSIWDNDIVFYDYVCEKGLIKRSILFKDQMIIGVHEQEFVGLIDSKDESILTNLTL